MLKIPGHGRLRTGSLWIANGESGHLLSAKYNADDTLPARPTASQKQRCRYVTGARTRWKRLRASSPNANNG